MNKSQNLQTLLNYLNSLPFSKTQKEKLLDKFLSQSYQGQEEIIDKLDQLSQKVQKIKEKRQENIAKIKEEGRSSWRKVAQELDLEDVKLEKSVADQKSYQDLLKKIKDDEL